MRNLIKVTGIITIMVIIAFLMAACGGDETPILPTADPCAGGHAYSTVAATCTTDSIPGTCTQTDCNKQDPAAVVVKLGHHAPSGTEPTCTVAGNSGTGICQRVNCGYEVTGEVIPPRGHSYPATTPATCTTASIKYACNRTINGIACGGTNSEAIVNALGHTGLTGANAATCTTAGNSAEHGTCTRCSTVIAGTVLPALGHIGLTGATTATCTAAGNLANHGTCTRCSTVIAGTVINALGHDCNWSTFNSSTGHISCNRTGCSGGLAAIGDTGPAGGKIVYVAASGFTVTGAGSFTAHYLEASPVDMTSTLPMLWVTQDFYSTDILGTETGIGTGKANTTLILVETTNRAPAAKSCIDYNLGGKTDWFLPSRDELIEILNAKSHLGILGDNYWSSSQANYNTVYCYRYSTMGTSAKNYVYSVRAVRAF